MRITTRRATICALGAAILLSAGTGFMRVAVAGEPRQLRIGGTGMALATMRQIAGAFTAGRTDIAIDILPSLGTGGGLAALAAGAIDLALAARALTEAERATGLRDAAYARTPVAFVTHPSNSLAAITTTQIADVLTGTMTTWPDGTPVRLVRREPSDADWKMLRGISPEMDRAVDVALRRPGLLTVATDQDNANLLERLHGSFGAISIGQLRAEDRHLTLFDLDGAPPTIDALISGRYKLARTLWAAWRQPPGPELAAFLTFLQGPQASDILTRLGHVPSVGHAP